MDYRTTGAPAPAPAPAPANPRHFLGAGAPAPAPAFFLKNRGLAGECLFAHNSKSFELIKKNWTDPESVRQGLQFELYTTYICRLFPHITLMNSVSRAHGPKKSNYTGHTTLVDIKILNLLKIWQ